VLSNVLAEMRRNADGLPNLRHRSRTPDPPSTESRVACPPVGRPDRVFGMWTRRESWHRRCDVRVIPADVEVAMIDRGKVLAVLSNRFPDASNRELTAAAAAVSGLPDEWEDVSDREEELGYHYCAQCSDLCYLAQQAERGDEFKIFRRRTTRIR
jgi:hypothetical protein